MAELAGFRAYARLEDDDPVADACFNAAVDYGVTVGIPKMEGNGLYDLFVYAVALHFYDNRGFSPGLQVNAILQSDFVDRQITKLKIMLELEARKGGGENGDP